MYPLVVINTVYMHLSLTNITGDLVMECFACQLLMKCTISVSVCVALSLVYTFISLTHVHALLFSLLTHSLTLSLSYSAPVQQAQTVEMFQAI